MSDEESIEGPRLARDTRADGEAEIAASFVEEALHALDDMARVRVQERLRFVAETARARFGCAGWWLARVEGGLVSPRERGARDEVTLRRLQAASQRVRPLRTPAVRAALEGGSLYVTDEDPALGERLREAGMTEVVAVGGYDTDAVQWLVCLGADGGGETLRATRSALFAAVQAALGFPRGPRPGGR